MSVATQAQPSLEQLIARQQALVAELREVDHWRRLVAARLDLAIAAVTDLDEPSRIMLHGAPPSRGLRDLLGIPPAVEALPDAAVLIPLREVLADLDGYRRTLRDSAAEATRIALERLARTDQLRRLSLAQAPAEDLG